MKTVLTGSERNARRGCTPSWTNPTLRPSRRARRPTRARKRTTRRAEAEPDDAPADAGSKQTTRRRGAEPDDAPADAGPKADDETPAEPADAPADAGNKADDETPAEAKADEPDAKARTMAKMCTLEFKGDEPTEQDVRAACEEIGLGATAMVLWRAFPEDQVAKMAFSTEEEAREFAQKMPEYVKKHHDNSWTVSYGNSKKGGSAAAADEAGDGAKDDDANAAKSPAELADRSVVVRCAATTTDDDVLRFLSRRRRVPSGRDPQRPGSSRGRGAAGGARSRGERRRTRDDLVPFTDPEMAMDAARRQPRLEGRAPGNWSLKVTLTLHEKTLDEVGDAEARRLSGEVAEAADVPPARVTVLSRSGGSVVLALRVGGFKLMREIDSCTTKLSKKRASLISKDAWGRFTVDFIDPEESADDATAPKRMCVIKWNAGDAEVNVLVVKQKCDEIGMKDFGLSGCKRPEEGEPPDGALQLRRCRAILRREVQRVVPDGLGAPAAGRWNGAQAVQRKTRPEPAPAAGGRDDDEGARRGEARAEGAQVQIRPGARPGSRTTSLLLSRRLRPSARAARGAAPARRRRRLEKRLQQQQQMEEMAKKQTDDEVVARCARPVGGGGD